MAYVVGILSEEEMTELKARGWEIEGAPSQLIPDEMPLAERGRMKMVWVDASMFEIMNGPDWQRGTDVEGDFPAGFTQVD